MNLWFVFAMMTAAAIFAVLWPLRRRRGPVSAGNDVLVYRDQLEEIGRDRAAGRIGDAEAEAARVEVSRRLLAAADRAANELPVFSRWGRQAVVVAALVLLPAGAAALYLALGSPSLPGQPLTARLGPLGTPPITRLVAQIEEHLQRDPKDGRGWEVLAPVYMQLGRFEDAVKAWRNALVYNGSTAEREANLGEALIAVANGIVTADAKKAFERAVTLEANDAKARYFLGLSAEQDGRHAEAAAIWRALLASAPPGAPWAPFVRNALAQIDGAPVANSPEPSGDDIAAAGDLNPEQRQQMIAGMVDRLATRLKSDGADIEGWLRLVRAYTVLGEREKARSAAGDARRAIGDNADNLRRLDDLVKGLGLEG
jgi:cytochrome c-type biogenesis protein CcmH